MGEEQSYHIEIEYLGFASHSLFESQSLDLRLNAFNILTGDSGSGKTTLLHSLVGYPDPYRLEKVTISPTASCALLPQQPQHTFPPTVKVGEALKDIAKANHNHLLPESFLEELGLSNSSGLLQQYPHQCSGGELQRLALIACYLQDPDIILLDEPTASLDIGNVEILIESLQKWMSTAASKTVFITSHQSERFEGLTQRRFQMKQHKIVLHKHMEEQPLVYLVQESGSTDLIYAVKNGIFKYPKRQQTYHASLEIKKGDSIGLTGPSGGGKSTLAKLICGWLQWNQYDALDIPHSTTSSIQYIGQDPVALFHPFRKMGDQLQLVWNQWSHRHEESMLDFLKRFKVDAELLSRSILEVSGGQRQRLQLARTFMSQPDLVILDENLSALDRSLKYELASELTALQKSEHLAIIWIAHDLDLLASTCQEVLLIQEGQITQRLHPEKNQKYFHSAVTNALFNTYKG